MELFNEAKGYASRKTAEAKLAKVLPAYRDYRYMFVTLPTNRILPVLQISGTHDSWMAASLAGNGIGVI